MPRIPDPLTRRTAALVTRFRRQRPLRAGSLLVTILGDAIAPRGGVIALTSLIELARPFGLSERHVRTSIGRLAQEQWVGSQRSGRASFYSLTDRGRARFAEATQRIYAAEPPSWNGEWTLVIVLRSPAAKRERLREELTWLGFGQLTHSVFARPTRSDRTISARLAELEAAQQAIIAQQAVLAQTSHEQLIRMGWDFADLTRRYRRFIDMFAPMAEQVSRPASLAGETAFVLRTLLVHEYRKIHLRDPQLPAALLPQDWIGIDAYRLCRNLYAKVFAESERHLTAQVRTLSGSLPKPARAVFARFGGLSS